MWIFSLVIVFIYPNTNDFYKFTIGCQYTVYIKFIVCLIVTGKSVTYKRKKVTISKTRSVVFLFHIVSSHSKFTKCIALSDRK